MGTRRAAMPPLLQFQAKHQAGVISRRQALTAKMTRDAIRARMKSGRWRRVCRSVYATFSGPMSREARLWAAVLYAGEGALLSHETAAELHGLNDERASLIHVTIPLKRQVQVIPGLVVHRSRRPTAEGLSFPEGELPRTDVEETILDLATEMDSLDGVCAVVTRAFARGLTSVQFMSFALDQRERQRWRAEIGEFVAAAMGGAHSVLEFRYDRDVERAHGLPLSAHQVPFRKKDGSRGYRDRAFEGYKLIIELDGDAAHPGDKRREDKRRDNAAAAGGEQSLRYGWQDVRWNPCDTADEIVRVLRNRGWEGRPKPCSPGCPVGRPAGRLVSGPGTRREYSLTDLWGSS